MGKPGWAALALVAVMMAGSACGKKAIDATPSPPKAEGESGTTPQPKQPKPVKPPKPPRDKYSKLTTQEVYDLAVAQSRKRSYSKARDIFQKVLGRTDATPDLIAKVHLELADAYFYDGGVINLAEAQSRYSNFLTFYPNHERADYAQYQLGLCYLKQAARPDRDQYQTYFALDALTKVQANYPNSEYVGASSQKADEAREILAEHEFRIGRFYFRRKGYYGALERFRFVLEYYPKYSRKDRLYLLLGQSLMVVDKMDDGHLYLEKLVAEFPDSRYAGQARGILEQSQATAATPAPKGP